MPWFDHLVMTAYDPRHPDRGWLTHRRTLLKSCRGQGQLVVASADDSDLPGLAVSFPAGMKHSVLLSIVDRPH